MWNHRTLWWLFYWCVFWFVMQMPVDTMTPKCPCKPASFSKAFKMTDAVKTSTRVLKLQLSRESHATMCWSLPGMFVSASIRQKDTCHWIIMKSPVDLCFVEVAAAVQKNVRDIIENRVKDGWGRRVKDAREKQSTGHREQTKHTVISVAPFYILISTDIYWQEQKNDDIWKATDNHYMLTFLLQMCFTRLTRF